MSIPPFLPCLSHCIFFFSPPLCSVFIFNYTFFLNVLFDLKIRLFCIIFCSLLIFSMLLFLYVSLIFPMLIPIKSLCGWFHCCINCFFLEFRNILKLLSLENRNPVWMKSRSLRESALPDTEGLQIWNPFKWSAWGFPLNDMNQGAGDLCPPT